MIQKLIAGMGALMVLMACSPNEVALIDESTIDLNKTFIQQHEVLADGTYFMLEAEFDEEGWRRFIEFSVEDSQIATVNFDGVNYFAATFKTAASANELNPINGDAGQDLRWDQQMEILQRFILEFGALDGLWEPDGFTLDIALYENLFWQALEQGPIESGPYLNGRYFLEEDLSTDADLESLLEDELDYRYFLNMIVRHGYIIAVHWNAINSEGIRKYEPLLTGSILDTEDEIQIWRAQAALMEAHLIATQDPMLMTFDEEELSQEMFGVNIPVQSFIELAVSALAAGPLLEN